MIDPSAPRADQPLEAAHAPEGSAASAASEASAQSGRSVRPPVVRTRLHSRGRRLADRLPAWLGSIRFRLTAVYSTVVFGLAALVVGSIYLGLRYSLENQKISAIVLQLPSGQTVIRADQAEVVQALVNKRALDALRVYSFGALLALFVASLVVGWFVSGRMLRPIGEMAAAVRRIQASDLSQRIELGGPDDELRALADTFDGMLERIDDAFEGQRQFIHEASHELRNPLAVIRTNLDVTLADPDASADELRHTGEVVLRSTERMTRLVDDLLVYARKGTLSLTFESVDVGTLVDDAADEFAAPADAAGLRLVREAPAGLTVIGDRLALRQALANLLANAVRLAPAGTEIRVRAGREEGWVWLAVEDDGPGIDPADHDRVFQRFWRGDPREGREQGRSGLGLTIVRQVAEAHGGDVRLASEPGRGAAFALWLPAAPTPV